MIDVQLAEIYGVEARAFGEEKIVVRILTDYTFKV